MSLISDMLAAANRLLTFYNGDEKTAANPGGMTGVGGMADNWDPCIRDLGTAVNGVGEALATIATSETNVVASATAAATDAAAAHSDRLAADADAQATAADRAAVAADRTATHTDRLAADADAQATATDRMAVAADRTAVATDKAAAQSAAASAAASAGEARWCGTAGGTANALTLTPATPITALFDGLQVRFRAAQANGPVARANQLRNNAMAGAAVGSPGTAPTNWSGVGTNAGITLAVAATGTTAAGAPYIDVRISGTSSAATSAILIFEGTTQIAAAPGQVWSQNVELALVAGSTSGTGVVLGIREGDSGGSVLNDAVTPNLTLTGTLTRYAQTAMLTNAGTTRAYPRLRVSMNSGVTVDMTIRVSRPHFEQSGSIMPPIATNGAAVTGSDGHCTLAVSGLPAKWLVDVEGNAVPKGAWIGSQLLDATYVANGDCWCVTSGPVGAVMPAGTSMAPGLAVVGDSDTGLAQVAGLGTLSFITDLFERFRLANATSILRGCWLRIEDAVGTVIGMFGPTGSGNVVVGAYSNHDLEVRTGNLTAALFKYVAGANRNPVFSPSAGGNPTITTTGGALNLTSATGSVLVNGAALTSVANFPVVAKSAAYTVTLADAGKLIEATGTWAMALPAAASVGNGYTVIVANVGTGTITIAPNGSELVNGAATISLPPNRWAILTCDGTKWRALLTTSVTSTTTFNPADKSGALVLSNGNLTVTTSAASIGAARATNTLSGNFYWETVCVAGAPGTITGVMSASSSLATYVGAEASSWGYASDGKKYSGGSGATFAASYTVGDVIGHAYKNGNLWFSKNGVWQGGGDPVAGTAPAFTGIPATALPGVSMGGDGNPHAMTGQFSSASWAYAAPSGFSQFS